MNLPKPQINEATLAGIQHSKGTFRIWIQAEKLVLCGRANRDGPYG